MRENCINRESGCRCREIKRLSAEKKTFNQIRLQDRRSTPMKIIGLTRDIKINGEGKD